ncbi:hypothetical protein PVAG01_02992 [Phlyctema vagabunda]|uniref:Uncharacterized protein n=1 Tax=Phlyctema vagabunda TaxID=108571 RepID=A0ABR4PTK5_9HELO
MRPIVDKAFVIKGLKTQESTDARNIHIGTSGGKKYTKRKHIDMHTNGDDEFSASTQRGSRSKRVKMIDFPGDIAPVASSSFVQESWDPRLAYQYYTNQALPPTTTDGLNNVSMPALGNIHDFAKSGSGAGDLDSPWPLEALHGTAGSKSPEPLQTTDFDATAIGTKLLCQGDWDQWTIAFEHDLDNATKHAQSGLTSQ